MEAVTATQPPMTLAKDEKSAVLESWRDVDFLHRQGQSEREKKTVFKNLRWEEETNMMSRPLLIQRRPFILALLSLTVSIVVADEPPTLESLAWYTPDREFKPVEPAPWVYEGIEKAFVSDFANPRTLPYIDELAAMGVTVIHLGGPEPYYPPKRDGGAYSNPAERALMRAAFDRMRGHGMRIVIGVSPYAPPEIVKQHPEWRLKSSPNEKLLDPSLDLTRPENVPLRSLSLNTPYGDYLIENIAEMFQDLKVDGVSFDGNYHSPINYTPFDIELFRKETGRDFPAKIDLADDGY